MTRLTETLCDVVVSWVDFDPIPKCTSRCMLILTTNGYKPTELPFTAVGADDERGLIEAIAEQNKAYSVFISTVLKVPPTRVAGEKSYALAYFLFPRSLLNAHLAFFLAVQDRETAGVPGNVVGYSDFVDDELKRVFAYFSSDSSIWGRARDRTKLVFPLGYTAASSLYEEMSSSRCTIEATCFPLLDGTMVATSRIGEEEKVPEKISSVVSRLEVASGAKERWQILSKELGQKQEIVNRMMKDIDDRKQSLKTTGTEIVDLRRDIKLLQSENGGLKRRLDEEQRLQTSQLVTKEISRMNSDEVRSKLLKLAEAYRAQRIRNDDFDKALKSAHAEISLAKKLEAELEVLQSTHQEKAHKLLKMQQEVQKIDMYKDTTKKQEKVIAKLEALMDKALREAQQSRQDEVELERLRAENVQLQRELSAGVFRSEIDVNPEAERYRKEVKRMEEQIDVLKSEMMGKKQSGKRESPGKEEDWDMERIELEVRLQQTEARNKAIDDEMAANAEAYAREIADLKAELMQKEGLLQAAGIKLSDTLA